MTFLETKWRIGVVAQVTAQVLTVEGHINEFRDRIFDGAPQKFGSVNQFLYTFQGRHKISLYKVFDISRKEKPLGHGESSKLSEIITIRAVPYGTLQNSEFQLGVDDFPMVGDYVYAAYNKLLEVIFDAPQGAISLGSLTGFPTVAPKISIDDVLGGHSAIFGNTGSGKSTTARYLLHEVAKKMKDPNSGIKKGTKIVVLDLHGDYKFLTQKGYSHVHHLDSNSLAISPTDISQEDWYAALLPSQAIQRPLLERALRYAQISEDGKAHIYLSFAYNIMQNIGTDSLQLKLDQTKKLISLAEDHCNNWKKSFSSIASNLKINYGKIEPPDTRDQLIQKIEQILNPYFTTAAPDIDKILAAFSNKQYFNSVACLDLALELVLLEEETFGNHSARQHTQGLTVRVKNFCERYKTLIKVDRNSLFNWIDNTSGILVLDLQKLNDDEGLSLVANALTRKMLHEQQNTASRILTPRVLVLDEAHRYIRNDLVTDSSIFERVGREGRKFGVYLLYISQVPSELSRVLIAQTTAFLIHRIQNSYDLDFLRKNLPSVSSEADISRMPNFKAGHAMVTGSSIRATMEVTIPGDFKGLTPSVSFMQE